MQQIIKTRSGRVLILPTPEEEARINAGIAADPDTYELSDEDISRLQPYKRTVTLNLTPSVVDAFQATGEGWQTLIDTALQQWLTEHPTHG
jgi:uncharacterized protein (DUF4415 family)